MRDSHELFDYESPHIVKKHLRLNNSGNPLTLKLSIAKLQRKEDHDIKAIEGELSANRKSIAYICRSKGENHDSN